MKKPISVYYPFTFIREEVAGACAARFGPVAVYQPAAGAVPESLGRLEKQGIIELRFPVKEDDSRLIELARGFQNWGQMHEKAAAAVKKFAENGFYNQEFAPEIKTEILGKSSGPEPDPGPVFRARLFLLLAQQYDRQTCELEDELSVADSAARRLFSGIKGEESQDPGFSGGLEKPSRSPDPGGYMTESRISAFNHLMEADPFAPDILLTPSPAVIRAVKERHGSVEELGGAPEDVLGPEGMRDIPDDGFQTRFFRSKDRGLVFCLVLPPDIGA